MIEKKDSNSGLRHELRCSFHVYPYLNDVYYT